MSRLAIIQNICSVTETNRIAKHLLLICFSYFAYFFPNPCANVMMNLIWRMLSFKRWFTHVFASKTIIVTTGTCWYQLVLIFIYFWVYNFFLFILKLLISSHHDTKIQKLMNTINSSSIPNPHVSWNPASAVN